MLRRTKAELMEQGKLTTMPSRKWDLIPVNLDESEMSLYQKILLFSQTLFAQFLHQRAEKGQEIVNLRNSNGKKLFLYIMILNILSREIDHSKKLIEEIDFSNPLQSFMILSAKRVDIFNSQK